MLGVFLLGPRVATSQVLVQRDSHLNFNYTFGGGSTVFQDNRTLNPTSLVSSDSLSLGHTQTEQGTVPAGPWTAGIDVALNQNFSISGPLDRFHRIQATASSRGETVTDGFGSAGLFAANPGNRLFLYFDLHQSEEYRLVGELAFTGAASSQTAVALQRWDGVVWQNVRTTIGLPDSQGAFDWSGSLAAGEYRLLSGLNLSLPGGGQSSSRSYQYDFQLTSVPEPSAAVLVACTLLGGSVVRRRHRLIDRRLRLTNEVA
jgi:hypothetical protein